MICKDLRKHHTESVNGCGSTYWMAWIFRIPKWVSKKLFCCCSCHDLQYEWRDDKEKADLDLRACIRHMALTGRKWLKWITWKTGDLIYWALNTNLSKKCYNKA